MTITLESLGLSADEISQRVVDQLCHQLTKRVSIDDEGGEHHLPSDLAEKLNRAIAKRVDEAIEKIAAEHVLPNVAGYLEKFCLQATNEWGERRGKALSFTQYLVQRAEHYMTEKVNYNGKSKSEDGYGGWSGTQTRITHLINAHLHYHIESAMKKALQEANNSIAKGLEETVKTKMAEIAASLSVKVTAK